MLFDRGGLGFINILVAEKSSRGVGNGENATAGEVFKSICAFFCTGVPKVLRWCVGSGDESCDTSCQSQGRLRSRHLRQGLSSSHFNFEEAQDLHA
jgi:hypothetical protein